MKRLMVIAILALATAAVVGAGFAIAHSKKYDSSTSAKFVGSPYSGDFEGKVKSSKAGCVKKRKVTVFREQGNAKIGEDLTDKKGKWNVGFEGLIETGRYHASVKKATLVKNKKHKHICKATTSGNITVAGG